MTDASINHLQRSLDRAILLAALQNAQQIDIFIFRNYYSKNRNTLVFMKKGDNSAEKTYLCAFTLQIELLYFTLRYLFMVISSRLGGCKTARMLVGWMRVYKFLEETSLFLFSSSESVGKL